MECTLKVNTEVKFSWDKDIFKVVGTWTDGIVFAKIDKLSECLIYTNNDILELIETNKFEMVI